MQVRESGRASGRDRSYKSWSCFEETALHDVLQDDFQVVSRFLRPDLAEFLSLRSLLEPTWGVSALL
ncbi:hypothetical protein N657DRAFT_650285 [Parathielavia appendiculata]|uniref:Uncharacterized protein n=1 Tax=Parathielavia appendiculata TaxID=2587402 RepID=A0AAN6TS75_9PEZI|nr:hypothetical protein N657DRAFT_650285 [Parathielavia appendiculata]